MGYRCAHDPAGSERRAKTLGERARGAKRDLLRAADRLPTEGAAKDLPPKSTVHDYLELWDWDGTLERIHHAERICDHTQTRVDKVNPSFLPGRSVANNNAMTMRINRFSGKTE